MRALELKDVRRSPPWVVFLDRDGVINRKRPEGDYVKSWEEFEFLPGVSEALRLLKGHGIRMIVTTNQRGVALGRLMESELRTIHERMQAELSQAGAGLDAIYYCPHDYNSCKCRKPEIGLFLQAQAESPEIDFRYSFVVGDSMVDMHAATRLGCKKVFIAGDAAETSSVLARRNLRIDYSSPNLLEATTGYLIAAAKTH